MKNLFFFKEREMMELHCAFILFENHQKCLIFSTTWKKLIVVAQCEQIWNKSHFAIRFARNIENETF